MTMLEKLAASIKEIGQREPIVLMVGIGRQKHTVIDGKRRIMALKKLKLKTVQAIFVGDEDRKPKRVNISNIKGF